MCSRIEQHELEHPLDCEWSEYGNAICSGSIFLLTPASKAHSTREKYVKCFYVGHKHFSECHNWNSPLEWVHINFRIFLWWCFLNVCGIELWLLLKGCFLNTAFFPFTMSGNMKKWDEKKSFQIWYEQKKCNWIFLSWIGIDGMSLDVFVIPCAWWWAENSPTCFFPNTAAIKGIDLHFSHTILIPNKMLL